MRRVRTSTWVLLAIFLGTLVLYLWVKPVHSATTGNSPGASQQRTSPAPSHTRRPAARHTPHRSPSPAPPSPRRTATPRQTVTPQPTITPTSAPPTSPAPSPSPSATVPGTP